MIIVRVMLTACFNRESQGQENIIREQERSGKIGEKSVLSEISCFAPEPETFGEK